MPYAFNILDLAKYQADPEYKVMINHMILPVLNQSKETINANKKVMDEEAILVAESIPDERMQAIIKIVRDGAGRRKGIHKNHLRIYQSKTGKGGWKRV